MKCWQQTRMFGVVCRHKLLLVANFYPSSVAASAKSGVCVTAYLLHTAAPESRA